MAQITEGYMPKKSKAHLRSKKPKAQISVDKQKVAFEKTKLI